MKPNTPYEPPTHAELTSMLQFICGQNFQNFDAIINQAFPPYISPTKTQGKNLRTLYRLKGKGLVLLKTNFIKKPKNPV